MKNSYDVIVIGAGPAGGQCAREITSSGKSVLLVEKKHNLSINSYSSAGSPNEIMEQFQLPSSIVGAKWNKIVLHSSKSKLTWETPHPRGVVLDFSELRSFLAKETVRQGGTLKLGFSYLKHQITPAGVTVWLRDNKTKATHPFQSKILVDATGGEAHILGQSKSAHFDSTGIEYLVEVPPEIYAQWEGSLSFFMGHKWMSQGYSWIFPMKPNQLKIGVGRYFQDKIYVPHQKPYQYYVNNMIQNCLGSEDYNIIDRHGKTISYTYHQKDPHYQGPVIAIGDSVSSVNPLAFEGIRHGMTSARIASKHIIKKLENSRHSFKGYQKELCQYYGYKWRLCELFMKRIYREPCDEKVEKMLRAYRSFSFDEMVEFGFFYRLRYFIKYAWNYFIS